MDNPSLSKKYQLPNNDFINFGYSCVDTTQCESMLQMYVNSNDDDSDNYIDVKQRVSCYTNDAPDGNAINHQSSSQFHADQGIAYKDELNSSFCACRVDYGWQGPLCDIPSNRSKNASYLFFALFAFMIILIFYRGRLSFKAWKAKVLRKNDARGFTMKTTMFAHSIFAPLSALSYAIYYLIGPGVGKTSEGIRIFQSVTYQICIALTLLSMLILLLAFIEIATSMKQLKGFQRARYPIIALSIFFFVSQMALFFSGRGNDAIYITIAMIAILVILVLIGPGWMFFKFSASLLHERSKVFSPNGSAIEEKFGEKKQTFVGGCTDCLRALCEDITRSITGHTDTIQGTDTGGEQSSSNSKNSRSSRDEKATDLVPKPLQVSVNPRDEKDKTQSVKLGSAIITVISKNDPSTRPRADSKESKESKESKDSKESFEMSMIAIRDRAHSKESQSSAGSKDSKTPLNEEQFKAFLQSKRISRGKSKKDIDGSDNSKTDAQAEALKKAMKQNHSDRKVAKFLSRVLQLSIRIGIALLLFILSTVVTIPMGSNYFTLSLNVAALSLLSITRFFQLFYAFIVLDSILWFFSDVLKKEIKKKEGRNSNLGNNGTPVNNEAKRTNENGSKDENAGESLKRFGSKTEISKTSSVVLNANGSFIASKLAQSKEEHVDLDEAVDVVVTGDEAKV